MSRIGPFPSVGSSVVDISTTTGGRVRTTKLSDGPSMVIYSLFFYPVLVSEPLFF